MSFLSEGAFEQLSLSISLPCRRHMMTSPGQCRRDSRSWPVSVVFPPEFTRIPRGGACRSLEAANKINWVNPLCDGTWQCYTKNSHPARGLPEQPLAVPELVASGPVSVDLSTKSTTHAPHSVQRDAVTHILHSVQRGLLKGGGPRSPAQGFERLPPTRARRAGRAERRRPGLTSAQQVWDFSFWGKRWGLSPGALRAQHGVNLALGSAAVVDLPKRGQKRRRHK